MNWWETLTDETPSAAPVATAPVAGGNWWDALIDETNDPLHDPTFGGRYVATQPSRDERAMLLQAGRIDPLGMSLLPMPDISLPTLPADKVWSTGKTWREMTPEERQQAVEMDSIASETDPKLREWKIAKSVQNDVARQREQPTTATITDYKRDVARRQVMGGRDPGVPYEQLPLDEQQKIEQRAIDNLLAAGVDINTWDQLHKNSEQGFATIRDEQRRYDAAHPTPLPPETADQLIEKARALPNHAGMRDAAIQEAYAYRQRLAQNVADTAAADKLGMAPQEYKDYIFKGGDLGRNDIAVGPVTISTRSVPWRMAETLGEGIVGGVAKLFLTAGTELGSDTMRQLRDDFAQSQRFWQMQQERLDKDSGVRGAGLLRGTAAGVGEALAAGETGGFPMLVAWFAAKGGESSLENSDRKGVTGWRKYGHAAASATIDASLAFLGGKVFGAGVNVLAGGRGGAEAALGNVLREAATKFNLGPATTRLTNVLGRTAGGAAGQTLDMVAAETAHYLADVAAYGDKYDGEPLAKRLEQAAISGFAMGAAGGGLHGAREKIRGRLQYIIDENNVELLAAIHHFAKVVEAKKTFIIEAAPPSWPTGEPPAESSRQSHVLKAQQEIEIIKTGAEELKDPKTGAVIQYKRFRTPEEEERIRYLESEIADAQQSRSVDASAPGAMNRVLTPLPYGGESFLTTIPYGGESFIANRGVLQDPTNAERIGSQVETRSETQGTQGETSSGVRVRDAAQDGVGAQAAETQVDQFKQVAVDKSIAFKDIAARPVAELNDAELEQLFLRTPDKGSRREALRELRNRQLPIPQRGVPQQKRGFTSEPERGYLAPDDPQITDNFDTVHNLLTSAGAKHESTSDSGSRYYTLPDGTAVRVADHPPNEATSQWMDRNNVEDIRADSIRAVPRIRQLLETEPVDGLSSGVQPSPPEPSNGSQSETSQVGQEVQQVSQKQADARQAEQGQALLETAPAATTTPTQPTATQAVVAREGTVVPNQVAKAEPTRQPRALTIERETIPADLEVSYDAIRAKTRERVSIKQNAREAYDELEASAGKFKALLDCLRA